MFDYQLAPEAFNFVTEQLSPVLDLEVFSYLCAAVAPVAVPCRSDSIDHILEGSAPSLEARLIEGAEFAAELFEVLGDPSKSVRLPADAGIYFQSFMPQLPRLVDNPDERWNDSLSIDWAKNGELVRNAGLSSECIRFALGFRRIHEEMTKVPGY